MALSSAAQQIADLFRETRVMDMAAIERAIGDRPRSVIRPMPGNRRVTP